MGEYELRMNMNYGCRWIIGEYELCVNMNYGWIWTLGKQKLWGNFRWIHHKYDGEAAQGGGKTQFLIG